MFFVTVSEQTGTLGLLPLSSPVASSRGLVLCLLLMKREERPERTAAGSSYLEVLGASCFPAK